MTKLEIEKYRWIKPSGFWKIPLSLQPLFSDGAERIGKGNSPQKRSLPVVYPILSN